METTNLDTLMEEFFEEIKYKLGVQPIYTPHEKEEDVDIEIKNILAMANENDDHKEVISLIINSIKYGSKYDVEVDEIYYSELRDMEKFVIKVAYLSRLLYRFGEDVVAKYTAQHPNTIAYLNLQKKYPIDDLYYIENIVETNFHKYCIKLKNKMLDMNYGLLSYLANVDKIIVGYGETKNVYEEYHIEYNGINFKNSFIFIKQFKVEFESDIDIIIEMLLNKDNLEFENIEPLLEKVHNILV